MATHVQSVVVVLLHTMFVILSHGAQIPPTPTPPATTLKDTDVRVQCRAGDMLLTINTPGAEPFVGMVYPRGLSKNSSCLAEFRSTMGTVKYSLPLRSCNTMPTQLDDGAVEYFNTVVIQPHLRLVTGQGRAYHVRCRYRSRENRPVPQGRALQPSARTGGGMSVNVLQIPGDLPMPGCSMRIYFGDPTTKEVAENVKIGDPLTLVVSIDSQDRYGLTVTDCTVRDGLGWAEQKLVDSEGCPIDPDIMAAFQYSADYTKASVTFPAHKFPYTDSVYYQCNARLCSREKGGCERPSCDLQRLRRDTAAVPEQDGGGAEEQDVGGASDQDGSPATIQVYSGLYVNEANDLANEQDDAVTKEKTPEDALCISQRDFAIGIAVAGLILMLAVLAAILVLVARRRGKAHSHTGSSIYSGPYTNTAYSHSS